MKRQCLLLVIVLTVFLLVSYGCRKETTGFSEAPGGEPGITREVKPEAESLPVTPPPPPKPTYRFAPLPILIGKNLKKVQELFGDPDDTDNWWWNDHENLKWKYIKDESEWGEENATVRFVDGKVAFFSLVLNNEAARNRNITIKNLLTPDFLQELKKKKPIEAYPKIGNKEGFFIFWKFPNFQLGLVGQANRPVCEEHKHLNLQTGLNEYRYEWLLDDWERQVFQELYLEGLNPRVDEMGYAWAKAWTADKEKKMSF